MQVDVRELNVNAPVNNASGDSGSSRQNDKKKKGGCCDDNQTSAAAGGRAMTDDLSERLFDRKRW